MVFNNNNIFNRVSNQASSSQASFNGGKAQNMKAPIYTQAFNAGNKEADLYLTPDFYGSQRSSLGQLAHCFRG
ncbi:hypothetical protein DSO57_1020512 [Entomophthora muscae]|uniref:Uncharacterized protein n=1 Tax=Entomophthora muscae TaxID=34485 RepID=A0ACC2RII5_9FUNG|nr:hypothetical protein DSO57_1020512 [Entomophthora muscae]